MMRDKVINIMERLKIARLTGSRDNGEEYIVGPYTFRLEWGTVDIRECDDGSSCPISGWIPSIYLNYEVEGKPLMAMLWGPGYRTFAGEGDNVVYAYDHEPHWRIDGIWQEDLPVIIDALQKKVENLDEAETRAMDFAARRFRWDLSKMVMSELKEKSNA